VKSSFKFSVIMSDISFFMLKSVRPIQQ
jgi:hypothetical protein